MMCSLKVDITNFWKKNNGDVKKLLSNKKLKNTRMALLQRRKRTIEKMSAQRKAEKVNKLVRIVIEKLSLSERVKYSKEEGLNLTSE